MTSRILINLSLALFVWQSARAQLAPAEDFFNGGAQFYISNNIPAALKRVEMGLKTYPNDEKLKKLEKLLKQQQQSQKNQQQQNQQQSQQQKNNQQKQKQKQQQNSQQKPGEQKQNPAEQKKEELQKQQEQQQKQSGDMSKGEGKNQRKSQPVKPGEMTLEEARHLLDAQKGNEQLLQLKPENKPHTNQRLVRDW